MTTADSVLQNLVEHIFSPLYELAVGISIVYFLYGVAKYVYDLNTENAEQQTFGRSHLLYGSIGVFIVLSVGGILGLLRGIFS